MDQTISIDLIISKNEFKENAVKYILFNDKGNEIATGIVPQSGPVTLTENLYLAHDGVATYTLMIWLDNTNYNQNFEMGHSVTGRISILSKQLRY